MASDFSALTGPLAYRVITLSANVDQMTEVIPPPWAGRVSARFITDAGKVSSIGPDAGTVTDDHDAVAAGVLYSVSLNYDGRKGGKSTTALIYFSTVAASATKVRLTFEASAG